MENKKCLWTESVTKSALDRLGSMRTNFISYAKASSTTSTNYGLCTVRGA